MNREDTLAQTMLHGYLLLALENRGLLIFDHKYDTVGNKLKALLGLRKVNFF